jgi:aspartyl protease family protein
MQKFAIHAVVWALALGLAGQFLVPGGPGTQPVPPENDARHAAAPQAALVPDRGFAGDDIVLERDGSGQFHLQALVNGEDTRFLVDTGADIVALTALDAERLGIAPRPDAFRPILRTAAGVGYAAPVRLDRLEVGGEEFRDVDAVVAQDLGTSLLGQSMLRRLGKVELQGDTMVIAHR